MAAQGGPCRERCRDAGCRSAEGRDALQVEGDRADVAELREKLQDENLTDDEMQDIMQRLSNLNRGKVSIARKLHRLIL